MARWIVGRAWANVAALAGLVAAVAVLAPSSVQAQAPPSNPDGVAVIIGNRAYKHPRVPAVEYAHNDAEAMRRYVIEVLGYREGNVLVVKDASQAELVSAFGTESNHRGQAHQFIRPNRSDLLVFYSGHGVPGRGGRGYLLPSDANPATAELNGYPLDTLLGNLAKLRHVTYSGASST